MYYLAGIPISDELYHHGIKGQRWGVRRFQNPDGTLTPEGKARYGNSLGERGIGNKGFIRKLATGDHVLLGSKRVGEWNERMLDKHIAKKEAKGKSHKISSAIREAQKGRNISRDIYESKASTGKMVAQDLLFGMAGAQNYRSARGRGVTRGKALVEALATAYIPLGGTVYDMVESHDAQKRRDRNNRPKETVHYVRM